MSEGKEGGEAAPQVANPGLAGLPPPELLYNPANFAHVALEPEVLNWITSFVPTRVELFPALAPLFPDYTPAAGGVDAMIKPPRPDGRECDLGTRRLDEPAPLQSDPTVLDLQLRALSKKSGLEPVAVRALENAEKNPKEILKWVASIAELRRSAPPPSVHYSRPMPEIEELMQEWPSSFEHLLRQVSAAQAEAVGSRCCKGCVRRGGPHALPRRPPHRHFSPLSNRAASPLTPLSSCASPLLALQVPLPTADMDMSTEEYARVVCSLLDIPVHSGGGGGDAPGPLIQALHVLFSLYAEFKGNAHFAQLHT